MRTQFSYRCPWVFNNSEPVKNWNQWECNTWWRTHKKLCSSMIFSRYPSVILDGRSKSRLDWVIDPQKTNAQTCSRNGIKEEQYGRNHSWRGSNLMTPKELPKWLNILQEASMISSTPGPWAWTQSSRSTPTSPMHNLSFTSRVRWSCSVEILSGKIPEEYDSWKLSSSHILRKA